ncbi:phage late control D family protein [Frateuria aurantia]
MPVRGAVLSIYLGYAEQSVGLVGQYTVDETEYAGPPDSIVLRGKSASMLGSGKSTRSGSWDRVPLSQIVADVAGRNGWTPLCSVADVVERADQVKESDFHFITRIARQHGCTAKLGNGKLIVVPLGMASSGSGKSISAITLTRSDLTRFQFQLADRSAVASAKAGYLDPSSGKLAIVDVANPNVPDGLPGVHVDRHLHPNRTAAQRAAKARIDAFNQSTAQVRLEMPGRTDLFAERPITVSGLKTGIDGTYIASSVEQTFTRAGWSTTVECNGGNDGKAAASGKRKQALKVVDVVS